MDIVDKEPLVLNLFATLSLVFFHEPWEDELQVWCIAQELSILSSADTPPKEAP